MQPALRAGVTAAAASRVAWACVARARVARRRASAPGVAPARLDRTRYLDRTNYRGTEVTLAEGLAAAAGAAVAVAALPPGLRQAAMVAAAAAGVLGALDDLGEEPTPARRKGLAGHLRAAADGEVTTGAVKLVGLAATGLAAAALHQRGTGRLPPAAPHVQALDAVTGGALVAGAANLLNLLDLRPGRAHKVALLLGPALGAAGGAAAGSAAALVDVDLREVGMLGDTGANAWGALLGVGALERLGRPGRSVALVVVVALTLASERVSFSAVIARTPVLREVDAFGRMPAP